MVKTSTRPKGATSYRETAFGIIPRSKLITLELEGTKKGLEYLHHLIQENKNVPVTPDLILKLHAISFGWIFPQWAGKYRIIQVAFSGKEAPPHYQVPELITNYCNDLKERLKYLPESEEENFIIKLVELLAWVQHRFVYIHPFQDYNGRTARMLTTFVLLQFNLPPVEIKAETGRDRARYLKAMQKADDGNLTFLETLISNALSESLERIKK